MASPLSGRGQPSAVGSGTRFGFRRAERPPVTIARRQGWLPRSSVTRTPFVVGAGLEWLEEPLLPGVLSHTLQDLLAQTLPARSRVPLPCPPDEPTCASCIRRRSRLHRTSRSRLHRTLRQGRSPHFPAKDHVVRETQGAFHRERPVTGMGACSVNRTSHQEPRGRWALVHRLFPAWG